MTGLTVFPVYIQTSKTRCAKLSRAVVGGTRGVMRNITDATCDLALWERRIPAPVSDFASQSVTDSGFRGCDVTAKAGPGLPALLADVRMFASREQETGGDWLLDDIAMLGAGFAKIVGCERVRVRLSRVADHGCAVFHVDTLPARLLCTYAGRGMQWADEPDVVRAELGLRGRTVEEANAAIVPHESRIRTMRTGEVSIFKGRLWPNGAEFGLVHRSYPVCCDDHARLRLVIDPDGHDY